MTAETNRLAVEPTVSWRREMVVGRPYLVKVDLRLASGSPEWPYDEEELAFTCMLDGALDFAVEAMEDASVVLHRFGGSYGPAEFVVTPVGTGAGTRSLWLTIVSSYGVPVGNAELKTQVRGPGKEREEPPPSAPEQRVMPSAAVVGEQAAAMLNTISVRISPLLPRSTDYRWSVSFSAGADTDSEAHVASGGPGRLTEIQNDVLRVLAQLSEQAALRETVVVFVVPYEIIDHPFDQWRYGEVALGAWFHVAVCLAVSVEPLRPTLTRRWAEILSRTPPTGASLRVTRSVDVGNIAKTDDVLCVVFDRPFDSARDYRHAADNILYAGVPLALIQRAATGTPRRIPASVMAELERQPTLEVLELVRRLRREAESGPSSDHPGRHLILMWNSPQLVDGPEIPAEVERVCAAAGIEGFSTRPVADQRADAAALREVFESACRRVGADTADCGYTNSGDKVVLVLPLEANEVLGKFIGGIHGALYGINRNRPRSRRITLRVALASGRFVQERRGVSSRAILEATQLLAVDSWNPIAESGGWRTSGLKLALNESTERQLLRGSIELGPEYLELDPGNEEIAGIFRVYPYDDAAYVARIVDALAAVFSAPVEARIILSEIGFPLDSVPFYPQALHDTWYEVISMLEAGALPGDGLLRLIRAALRVYRYNEKLNEILVDLTGKASGRASVIRRDADNYATMREDDWEILGTIADWFARGPGRAGSGLLVEPGRNLYPALAMLPHCMNISIIASSRDDIDWVVGQRLKLGGNWSGYWQAISRESFEEARVQFSLRSLLRQDSIFDLRRAEWDLGAMFFAEALVDDEVHFEQMVVAFLRALRPGARFAAAFLEGGHESLRITEQVLGEIASMCHAEHEIHRIAVRPAAASSAESTILLMLGVAGGG